MKMKHAISRSLPIGAELQLQGGVHFRLWAPKAKTPEVYFPDEKRSVSLKAEANGYFSVLVPEAAPGTLYSFRLDGNEAYPDPASRFQPEGPHGPSMIIDATTYRWSDRKWRGVSLRGQVLYEMHIGTFTQEGTWNAAIPFLARLKELGITVLELMPVADFPGKFNWGYDGVNMFAPTRNYGSPDNFRAFVNQAHTLGLGVLLDVVYNHFGPDGNYLTSFSDDYSTDRYANEWGSAINFDGPHSEPVREFFIANAAYWIREFHLDGLRIDATQQIFDSSAPNILSEIRRSARDAADGRSIILTAENEPQNADLARANGPHGIGLDALWNDDFHHCALVALTGHNEAYYSDFTGSSQELVNVATRGFLYQGQYSSWQKQPRGTPALDLFPEQFVTYLENHDQVANSSAGLRLHQQASPGRYRALTAFLLLAPGTPLLFQGQEFGSSKPFLFFADHKRELAGAVREGRAKFLSQFPSIASPEAQEKLADPGSRESFEHCKLDSAGWRENSAFLSLHADLLRLRRSEAAFSAQGGFGIEGSVLSPQAFVLRFFSSEDDDRILLVNLGHDLRLSPAPEPLLAPPAATQWQLRWSSEEQEYGGRGTPEIDTEKIWEIPGESALVFAPVVTSAATTK